MQDKKPEDRDITLVWYSDILPRTEEGIVQKHFTKKNITGEWYNLSETDLKWIYKKYGGIHYERTLPRTETETETGNETKDEDITVTTIDKKIELIFPFPDSFKDSWLLWKDYKKEEFGFRYKTVQSEQAALNSLVKMSGGKESDAVKIVHQSMANGWKGFFNLKDKSNGSDISAKGIQEAVARRVQERERRKQQEGQ